MAHTRNAVAPGKVEGFVVWKCLNSLDGPAGDLCPFFRACTVPRGYASISRSKTSKNLPKELTVEDPTRDDGLEEVVGPGRGLEAMYMTLF